MRNVHLLPVCTHSGHALNNYLAIVCQASLYTDYWLHSKLYESICETLKYSMGVDCDYREALCFAGVLLASMPAYASLVLAWMIAESTEFGTAVAILQSVVPLSLLLICICGVDFQSKLSLRWVLWTCFVSFVASALSVAGGVLACIGAARADSPELAFVSAALNFLSTSSVWATWLVVLAAVYPKKRFRRFKKANGWWRVQSEEQPQLHEPHGGDGVANALTLTVGLSTSTE